MTLRFATPADSRVMLEIYRQYIHTSVTFEYTLPTPAEFARRLADMQALYPCLVAVEGQECLGYAYAHRLRDYAAYQWSAELTIYLSPGAVGRGIGRRLYSALMQVLALQGFHTAYGVVTHPNPASQALHRTLGFVQQGLLAHSGYKNGQWHGVCWYEKQLRADHDEPQPVIPVDQLPPRAVEGILAAFSQPD